MFLPIYSTNQGSTAKDIHPIILYVRIQWIYRKVSFNYPARRYMPLDLTQDDISCFFVRLILLGSSGCVLSHLREDMGIRFVNSCVPAAVRHGSSLHRIFPKLLTRVPDVCPLTNAETIDSSPSRIESQTSVLRPTLKLFGSNPSQLES